MKLADLEWTSVLRHLPRWRALSPAGRRAFLTLQPKMSVWAADLDPAGRAELTEGGMATISGPIGGRCTLATELRPLLVALRAMSRLPPVPSLKRRLDPAYLEHQVTPDQMRPLSSSRVRYNNRVDRQAVAAVVSSSDWVGGFLEAETPEEMMAWESPYLTPGDIPRLVFPKTAQATRALILALSEHPEGYPLHDLGSLLPDVTEQNRAAAVEAALRYLLAFAWCHVDAGLAMVGLLPRVALRAAGPASSPEAVPVAEAFDAPVRMADMTTLLVEAGAEPLPLRGHDGAFYVRTQKALGALLVPIPAWLEATAFSAVSRQRETQVDPHAEVEDGDPAANVSRLEAAKSTLVHFQLASVDEANGRYRLAPTAAGRAWLVLPPGERLKHLLDVLRVSDQRTPDAYAAGGVRDFFPSGFPFRLRSGVDLRRRLCAAFLEAEDAFVPVTGWTLHHAQSRNPLLEGDEPAVSVENWWGEPITRDMLEDAWFSVLHHFLILRLLPYGGARMGRMEDGDVAFSVTPVGQYLLGATDELVYETGTEGEVVVQPDFEVVFLSPAPRLEVEMVRFAERTGTGVGALFRITRASVLRAAEQGLTTEQVLATLGAVSRTDLPANVARQIRDWIGATRHVRIRPTVLLECPDADTALRIKAFGGDSVTTITPTLLRLDDSPAATKTLVKRIREKGIFVTEVSGAGE